MFLHNDFTSKNPQPGKRRDKPEDLEKLSRYTIDNDRWDRRDFDRLLKQQPELSSARHKLAENIAGELGYDEGADALWLLYKINPQLLDDFSIRPSRLLNKRINEAMLDLDQYSSLRRWTRGEQVASALAFEKIEPYLEVLYDRMREQLEQQQRYEDAITEAGRARTEAQTADEILEQWLDDNPDADPTDETLVNLQQVSEDANEKAERAEQTAADEFTELEASLDAAVPDIQDSVGVALDKANDYLDTLNNMAQGWGQELRDLTRLPADRRLELAKRLNTPKFAQMSKLIGPFTREALAENKRKVVVIPEEIVDLTFGDDLPRVIPPELAKLDLEETEILFLKDMVEKRLVQYEMKGFEKIARGGIIYCHDGSGSMAGEREIWAKAVGLALLHVARKQKRSFYGIQFGGPNQIRIDDFRDTRNITPEKVIDFAEYFYGGGTDFQAPLRHAMDILKREHDENGAVQADIVFATDGQAHITPEFMSQLKDLQKKLDFKVWGIAIGTGGVNEVRREPLNTLCDGRVASIQSLLNAKDIRDIFRGI